VAAWACSRLRRSGDIAVVGKVMESTGQMYTQGNALMQELGGETTVGRRS